MLMWHKNSEFPATPCFLSVFYCLPLIYELNPLELRCSNFYLLFLLSSLWNISIFLCITEVDAVEGGRIIRKMLTCYHLDILCFSWFFVSLFPSFILLSMFSFFLFFSLVEDPYNKCIKLLRTSACDKYFVISFKFIDVVKCYDLCRNIQ